MHSLVQAISVAFLEELSLEPGSKLLATYAWRVEMWWNWVPDNWNSKKRSSIGQAWLFWFVEQTSPCTAEQRPERPEILAAQWEDVTLFWCTGSQYNCVVQLVVIDTVCLFALFRVVFLHAIPRSVCFCSQRGDLLIGIGDHLHRIEHKNCKLSLPYTATFTC